MGDSKYLIRVRPAPTPPIIGADRKPDFIDTTAGHVCAVLLIAAVLAAFLLMWKFIG